jgi:SAM-dependent methyltransferase
LTTSTGRIFERMSTLADPVRGRILVLLEGQDLAVTEICQVLGMPQSTTSRHLRILSDEGWVEVRKEGTRRLYILRPAKLDESARSLWEIVKNQVLELPETADDARQLREVLAMRRVRSREFFDRDAPEWDRVREELFGSEFGFQALPGLLDPRMEIGDLGCGTGLIASTLAPFVQRIHAVDDSEAMLDAARERLDRFDNVRFHHAGLESLPLESNSLDAAIMMLVLHHIPDPAAVLTEVARVLKPKGRLLLVDMVPHDRAEFEKQMGHVWLGFSEPDLRLRLESAGFVDPVYRALPSNRRGKGPALFVATCWKSRSNRPC